MYYQSKMALMYSVKEKSSKELSLWSDSELFAIRLKDNNTRVLFNEQDLIEWGVGAMALVPAILTILAIYYC